MGQRFSLQFVQPFSDSEMEFVQRRYSSIHSSAKLSIKVKSKSKSNTSFKFIRVSSPASKIRIPREMRNPTTKTSNSARKGLPILICSFNGIDALRFDEMYCMNVPMIHPKHRPRYRKMNALPSMRKYIVNDNMHAAMTAQTSIHRTLESNDCLVIPQSSSHWRTDHCAHIMSHASILRNMTFSYRGCTDARVQ